MPLTLGLRLCALLAALAPAWVRSQETLEIQVRDYAAAPITGTLNSTAGNAPYAARINFLREEPGGGTNRFFINDLNGTLSIFDKAAKTFTVYLDFNRNTAETPGATGLFPSFTRANGYANGLVTFQFDPECRNAASAHYGKFYTVHIETDTADGAAARLPNASAFPGFTNAAGFTPTNAQEAPGTDGVNTRQAVLIEWQDTNPADAIFQGTARELLRVEFNDRIHPMGDLLFNPLATNAAHPDWRRLYIAIGDGGAGEKNNATLHATPQRLDVLQGKILRLMPDDPDGAGPARYGIPADNPFVASASARAEIFAYGFRNPHRLAWDAVTGVLIAADIGLHSWEEVNVVHAGGNYGYAEREGTWVLDVATGFATGTLPANDAANNFIYPVVQYPHSALLGFGDGICGGFVYRGTRVPALQGKYVFGDITTGQILAADLSALLAADDGSPATLAAFQRVQILWDNPRTPAGLESYSRMYEIVASEYHARGGPDNNLPGSATVSDLTGGGRADIRLAVDAAGELYLLSKSDGMIREVLAAPMPAAPPSIARSPEAQTVGVGGTVVFSVEAVSSVAPGYQWYKNAVPIPGATSALLVLRNVTAADVANYSCTVTNALGSVMSSAAALILGGAGDAGKLTALSIRGRVGTGGNVMIAGLIVEGGSAPTLLQAVGPTLGVLAPELAPTVLANPNLELYQLTAGTFVRTQSNDDWAVPTANGTAVALAETATGATLLTNSQSRDSALLTTLSPGVYTANVNGVGSTTGVTLLQVYAVPSATDTGVLSALSIRGQVGTGGEVMIAGLIVGGSSARTVLIQAIGPTLGLMSPDLATSVLTNPKLELYQLVNGAFVKIRENDDWGGDAQITTIETATGATGLLNPTSRDCALLVTLPPGVYTANVSGVANSAGVVLLQAYVVP
ncbi:MAG TPA: PQQ-dependent sugar dehydrogenase [Opitutaceae bacterium]|nr:PQQ-dependent sugar dehydrogenase [Opitutaceae bacterium]